MEAILERMNDTVTDAMVRACVCVLVLAFDVHFVSVFVL